MKITALEEYGLRCMMQLGRCEPGESITIANIAEREGLSVANVRKIMMILREAKLVQSVRGRSGGYALAKDPGDITIGTILEALGGRLFDKDFCSRFTGGNGLCANTSSCTLRSLWGILDGVISGVLYRMTLVELVAEGPEVRAVLRDHLSGASEEVLNNSPQAVESSVINIGN